MSVFGVAVILVRIFPGEWPSGLERYSKNGKVPGSNPTRRSAGLRDSTSLQGSRWPSGRKRKTQWLTLVSESVPSIMAQSWPLGSQIAVKENFFSCIRTEYGEIWSISPYSVRIRENAGKMRIKITPNTSTFYAVGMDISVFLFDTQSVRIYIK